jgi:hypothetical protein
MMYALTIAGKAMIELVLAMAIKLFCDNGRINIKDLPGMFGFGADENGLIEDGFTKEMKERGLEW